MLSDKSIAGVIVRIAERSTKAPLVAKTVSKFVLYSFTTARPLQEGKSMPDIDFICGEIERMRMQVTRQRRDILEFRWASESRASSR
jgi:hypothetical protein